ncbi:hypothetical protein Poli38472_006155 [Pythium oligandrum]|uniref:EGF-like domain-containing protein n=1 Tax=Pythium oligandrum TaxID=41045 RepID=A0A8K1FR71_PYTOL|nr:hypothetical protein Poli38472_006155 [Pythium oligandrum]|eukprot:TMW68687.1 hypothetical protein Poli38472_006155 [Pythium oligandrum]
MTTRKRLHGLVLCIALLFVPCATAAGTVRRWRDFVFGKIRQDGVEYFDFDVTADTYRIIVSFDRGPLEGLTPPKMLLKYGSFPSTTDYDQMMLLNSTGDFYQARVNNLRSGRYFISLVGPDLFNSLVSFVGGVNSLFYFVSVWHFGCSDPAWTGSKCTVPVLPSAPIASSITTGVNSVYYPSTQSEFNGCLDAKTSTLYFSYDVPHPKWDLVYTLSTSAASELRVAASVNLRDPAEVAKNKDTKSVTLAAGLGDRSAELRIPAPLKGQWMVMVTGKPSGTASCKTGTGVNFKLKAEHQEDCNKVDKARFQTTPSLPKVDLCGIGYTRMNPMRNEPTKAGHIIDADFECSVPKTGGGKQAMNQTQPVVGYIVEVPKMYAGSNLQLAALVTANIQSFQVYARLDGYVTPSLFDYHFNSSESLEASHSDNVSDTWVAEVQQYRWKPVVFPKVGLWSIIFVADGALTSTQSTGSKNESFWAVDLSLHSYGCPETDACSGHGSCELSSTYNGLSYGTCSCHFGYGGEQCDTLTVSSKFRNHQIFLLIFSNVAILPVTILCCRRKLYIESVLFFSTGLISAIYHACDVELFCMFPYKFLMQMDFALSFNMIMLLSVHLSGARKQAKAGIEIVLFLITIIMATNNARSMVNWVLIGALCVLQFSVTLVYYFVLGSQRMGMTKMIAVKSFLLNSQNFDRRYGILGSVLWLAALSCWFTSSPTNYWIIHSIWHTGAMLAAYCFVGLRRNDRYKMISPATGIDVLAPNCGADLPLPSKATATICSESISLETDKESIAPINEA